MPSYHYHKPAWLPPNPTGSHQIERSGGRRGAIQPANQLAPPGSHIVSMHGTDRAGRIDLPFAGCRRYDRLSSLPILGSSARQGRAVQPFSGKAELPGGSTIKAPALAGFGRMQGGYTKKGSPRIPKSTNGPPSKSETERQSWSAEKCGVMLTDGRN